MIELSPAQWRPLAAAHRERADALVAGHVARRRRREAHPVEDFLFTYYPTRPNQLRVWHPGPGVRLLAAPSYDGRRGYRAVDGGFELDPGEVARRADGVTWVRRLLAATLDRPAQFGCFGLHEWAMVYGQPASEIRHDGWPLRLGSGGTGWRARTSTRSGSSRRPRGR